MSRRNGKDRHGKVRPPLVGLAQPEAVLTVPLFTHVLRFLSRRSAATRVAGVRPGTMTVWHDGADWRLSLHDRERNLVAFWRHGDLDLLLDAANSDLASESVRWKHRAHD